MIKLEKLFKLSYIKKKFQPTAYSVQFRSVAQSCPTLCDPVNRSTPGLPVHHNSRSLFKLVSIESGLNPAVAEAGISVQFSSVAQLCPTLGDPVNRSTPGLPDHHQLPEFTQTHVHRVGDAIQSSHPLSSPSPPVPNPSQHQGLFQ